MSKPLYYIGSGLLVGISAYAAYKYYLKLKNSKFMVDDEGFEDATKVKHLVI